jgi:cysteine rich repeat protein
MRKSLLALTLLSISMTSTAAFAQQQRSGTEAEQKACTRDVQKFCRPVIDQGDLTILACLKEHRSKISSACDQVLKNNGQ